MLRQVGRRLCKAQNWKYSRKYSSGSRTGNIPEEEVMVAVVMEEVRETEG